MKLVIANGSLSNILQRMPTVLLLILSLSVFSMHPVLAQTVDTNGPNIELEELTEAAAGQTQVFTVLITDDSLLTDATFYYRREGQLPYTPAPMQALGDTGYYSVSIPTDSNDLRAIEYYFQASDSAGNRTVSGFAFDPYQRQLRTTSAIPTTPTAAAQTPVQTISATPEEAEPETIFSQRWVQITLGVVAVGILASIANNDGSDSQVVPLTFNLQ